MMNKAIYNTLYFYDQEDETGFDIYEVMLLENIDRDRIPKLITLLGNDSRYISYQASLILISWNIEEGFAKFNQFYNERWDKKEEFEANRIYGQDNVYDIFVKSMKIFLYKQNSAQNLILYVRKLLSIYNKTFFEGNLKELLLSQNAFSKILSDIEKKMLDIIETKRFYQSSQ